MNRDVIDLIKALVVIVIIVAFIALPILPNLYGFRECERVGSLLTKGWVCTAARTQQRCLVYFGEGLQALDCED